MIRIDQALLRKFHRGECTAEECAAITDWMRNSEAATQMADERKMSELEARIWKNIEPREAGAPGSRPLLTRRFYYGVAAALLFLPVLGWLNGFKNMEQIVAPTIYTLNSADQKNMEVSGLDFTLANNSNAVVVTPLAGRHGGISFCGAVQITNNSGADIEYVFESACKKSAYTRKKVTFHSGKTYIAVHNFYKTDEVIVMKKEHVMEFPDAISTEVMSEFSI